MAIRPGNFTLDGDDYTDFVGSMAAEIEKQLNGLLLLDGLPALPGDPDDPSIEDREVRDRRRLFVAIARAVVKHLQDNAGAISIVRSDSTVAHPSFDVEWS
jgi:hypothetical protein